MRAPFLATAVFLLLPSTMPGQEVTPKTYVPPQLTLERLMQDDSTIGGTNLWALAGDKVKFRATVEEQAASGKLVAQMLLGEAYIPRECTFLPFRTAPADCPQDVAPDNFLGLTLSFDAAVHWLTLASKQGSGEASEILAQVMERAIRSSESSDYTMAEVARFHAMARSQGFDIQDVERSCYTLDTRGPADRLVMADMPPEYQFTQQELASLHAGGASGTIRWGGTNRAGMTTLLQHPEGPKVHTRIVVGSPATHEHLIPLGNRVDVVYLQQGDSISTVPTTYPTLSRQIAFRPASAGQPGGASLQAIDGTFASACDSRTFP